MLDTGPGPRGTIVCVHGNPTWSYLWREVLTTLAPDWRVIAVDQTGMGYSERGRPRVLAQRIEELVAFCKQEVTGPLILAAHDWGGPVAVGAADTVHPEAVILANTAVAQPDDVKVPPLIALARTLVDFSCRRTPAFVNGTAMMTHQRHRVALRAPYRTAARREAIRDFVVDIPLHPGDVSQRTLEKCADIFGALSCPILLLWGGNDPVFHDRFLRDLRSRAPHAAVQRFPDAGHLVLLDEAVGSSIRRWLDRPSAAAPSPPAAFRSLLAVLEERKLDTSAVYVGPDGMLRWDELDRASSTAASALVAGGMMPRDQVSLLIPPSPSLLVAAIAVWKAGGVPVVADASAGMRALRRLVRARAPRFVLGTHATLLAAKVLRAAPGAKAGLFGSLPGALDLRAGAARFDRRVIQPDDVAAIVHTSGATGAAKAVRYTHGQLAAQRAATVAMFNLRPGDAFTTSFGAFMLLSPLLEMTCIRPDFDVARPSELGFEEFTSALATGRVTTAWLSPASARTIVRTAAGRPAPIDVVMLAGAPVPDWLMDEVAHITGGAVRTPYGMTECLPVTDGMRSADRGSWGGLGVGSPLPACRIEIEVLPGVPWGEILVAAPWLFDGYEGAHDADQAASVIIDGTRFHRTGDVGYLDGGQLFSLGRRVHVIETARGPVASGAVEAALASTTDHDVAAVGVGPPGAQVVVVIVAAEGSLRLATQTLRDGVRSATTYPVAAVLEGKLPVDLRHQSKVDRAALQRAASVFLAGR